MKERYLLFNPSREEYIEVTKDYVKDIQRFVNHNIVPSEPEIINKFTDIIANSDKFMIANYKKDIDITDYETLRLLFQLKKIIQDINMTFVFIIKHANPEVLEVPASSIPIGYLDSHYYKGLSIKMCLKQEEAYNSYSKGKNTHWADVIIILRKLGYAVKLLQTEKCYRCRI